MHSFQSLFHVTSFLSLSALLTMTDVKHYIQIGSGRCERGPCLLWGTYTLRRLSVRGASENCAVMPKNAKRIIRLHFTAIISLSLSSNKHRRKKKMLHCSTWDVSVTLCWQFSVWVLFRQIQAYQCEPLLSLADWLSFVLRCNCAAVWH